MDYLKKIAVILLLSTSLQAEGCWNALELSKFAHDELDEVATFSLKDAITCEPLSGGKIKFLGTVFVADEKGYIKMPLPPEGIDADVPIMFRSKGYIPVNSTTMVSFGKYWQTLFLMTKEIPLGSARFILSWDAKPLDMDLHLRSEDFHISYRATRSIPNRVKLDRDATQGFGPETITLDKLKEDKTYRVIAHRYSLKGKITSKAKLSVYLNNKFDKSIALPNTDARCLEIATISNNQIDYEIKELPERACR